MENSSTSPAPGTEAAPAPAVRRPSPALADLPRALGLAQTLRLASCALAAGATLLAGRMRGPAGREASRRRAVSRVVATLGALKGAFAKAGQFAAVRHDVLPAEVTRALAELRDRVPPLPFSRIRGAVEGELGAPLESLFAAFDPTPLAAASVAQVHRARLPGGEEVAVKVQYPWLASSLRADLRLVRLLLRVFAWRAPAGIDPRRLFQEFAVGLREELDFEHEARAAQEIRANLADDARVVVPRTIPSHSTRRILTMSYHAALPISDPEGLEARGVPCDEVLSTLARAYAKQLFADGLFHADPHPGNLFVLDEPEATSAPRLLFVDFGLSRRLDPELRAEMRRASHALLQRDLDAFLAAMDRLGMIAPGARDAVGRACSAMLERVGAEGGLAVGGSKVLGLKDEAKRLLQETPGLQLPNDLLLCAKTLTYVFALGAELAPQVDLMRLSLPYVVQFLAERDAPTPPTASAGEAPGAG